MWFKSLDSLTKQLKSKRINYTVRAYDPDDVYYNERYTIGQATNPAHSYSDAENGPVDHPSGPAAYLTELHARYRPGGQGARAAASDWDSRL
jgi:hypothetical protein